MSGLPRRATPFFPLLNRLPARLIAFAVVFTVAVYPPQIILHRELSDLPADLVRLHARPAEMNAAEDACVNYIAGRVPEASVGARHAGKRGAGRAEAGVVAEELGQHLSRRRTRDAVAGEVLRVWRRRDERRPGRVGHGVGVAVVVLGSAVVLADRVDGPPEVEAVLGLEDHDDGVRQGHVEQGEDARVLRDAGLPLSRDRPRDPVPRERRALEPEARALRLLRRAQGARRAAVQLDLVNVGGVP